MMSDEFLFRASSNKDGEAVRCLASTVLHEFGFTLGSAATDADLADVESSYLSPGGSFDLLISPTGEVVGTVGLIPLGYGRCQLRKMFLSASCRGRGLGKRLLQQALDRARHLGFRRVELETSSAMVVACRLYESFGFRPRVPDHVSARSDRAYYLELDNDHTAERSY